MKLSVQIYPQDLNNTEIVEVHFSVNVSKYDSKSKGVLFVFTHHPIFIKVNSFFRNHLHLWRCFHGAVSMVLFPWCCF